MTMASYLNKGLKRKKWLGEEKTSSEWSSRNFRNNHRFHFSAIKDLDEYRKLENQWVSLINDWRGNEEREHRKVSF